MLKSILMSVVLKTDALNGASFHVMLNLKTPWMILYNLFIIRGFMKEGGI